MDQDAVHAASANLAVRAFDELRGELSLLRRAVERLTDERTSQPDYAPSLEAMSKRLEDVCTWARRISDKPALTLTPESFAREIVSAAASSREQDHQRLSRATEAMTTAQARIDAIIARSRAAAEQNRELNRNRLAFAVAGVALCSILPGAIARSLPISWAVPERMAARMLGLDMWHAGQDLIAKARPQPVPTIANRDVERSGR